MTYPTYFATYAVMSMEAGSNPFWHAILLTSEQPSATSPIKVTDAVGFYSKSPSTTTNPFLKTLKNILGFSFDLQYGNGQIKQEKMRYLEGLGLYGISFNIDNAKYNGLQTAYTNAKMDNKRKFHVTMKWTKTGFNTQESYTCKTLALDLLLNTNIIDDVQYKKIIGGQFQYAFPLYSGIKLPQIQLVSTGEPETHLSKRTMKTHYSRSWENNNSLFWAITPPKYGENISPNVLEQNLQIKMILSRARKLEISLLNKISSVHNKPNNKDWLIDLNTQLKQIRAIFEKFSLNNLQPKDLTEAQSTLNVASMTLTPKQVNYSFLIRAYKNTSLRHALLGFMTILISSIILIGPVGIISTLGLTLFTGYQLFQYYKTEQANALVRADYKKFHNIEPEKRALIPISMLSQTTVASPSSNDEIITSSSELLSSIGSPN